MSPNDVMVDMSNASNSEWTLRRVALGGSPLSRELQADAQHRWLSARPTSRDEWIARVQSVRASVQSTDWFTPLAPAFAVTGRAAERIGRAAASGVVVTTGQQPGLFGGPAYTISKALSALAMADALEEASGVPVAPVFWAATDDADWVEAASTAFATANGLELASLEGPPTDGVAMADVPLGSLTDALQLLRRACGSAAHASVMQLIENAYVEHATVGAAYVQLLRALLEPLGIAVLDAAHPSLRSAADPFLRQALQHAPAIQHALLQRTKDIVGAGFAPQVEIVDELSLVFRTTTGASGRERDRTRARVPVADAARVIREADHGSLGANVLLRPVMERALLPTVAYHAGPGEFAYFAQIAPIASALSAQAPLAVPRWSAEVVETRALRLAAERGLDDRMLLDPHAAESHVARALLDVELQDALERLRVAVETQMIAVREATGGDDAVVAPSVLEGLASDLSARLSRFERRVYASVKRRETSAMRDVAYIRAALRPLGQSPERKLNLMPFLVRYGPGVLDAMRHDAHTYAEQLVNGR